MRGHDQRVDAPEREFFYLPLRHSEMLADQEKDVRLVPAELRAAACCSTTPARTALIIRRFGRFPYRNAALGRESTPEEEAFLAAGGYRAAMAEVGPEAEPLALPAELR